MAKKFYELTDGGSSPRERGKHRIADGDNVFSGLIPA